MICRCRRSLFRRLFSPRLILIFLLIVDCLVSKYFMSIQKRVYTCMCTSIAFIQIQSFLFVQLNIEQHEVRRKNTRVKFDVHFYYHCLLLHRRRRDVFICNAFNICKKTFNYFFVVFFPFLYLVASHMPSVPE